MTASLQKYGIDAWSLDALRPAEVPVSHSFDLVDPTSIYYPVRRLSPRHNAVVREELDKMFEAGIIATELSAWSFPMVVASKKNVRTHFCVDYRVRKKVMKADRWPLPKIEETFDDLQGSKVLTTLDLFTSYWQVRMLEE